MPRVSVLMPTHNRAEVLGLAIQSVLTQTEPDFELLVVGDGCTDRTAEVVAAVRDSRVRFFDLPKAPHFGYANRNVALREARGELVAFAAHDDLLFPDHLEQMVRAIEQSTAEWMYSRPLWVSTDGVVVPYATNLMLADELGTFMTANTIPASCVVHRRSCFERYGYWPEDVPRAADWVYWMRILEGGGRRLGYVPTPTCLHFSAVWKASRHSAAPEVWELLQVADQAPWWPEALRYDVPAGALEQQVLAQAMQAPGWSDAVRDGVRVVLDRLAWDAVRRTAPAARVHAQEMERLQTALDAAAHAARERQAQLEDERDAALGAAQRASAEAAALNHEAAALRESLAGLAAEREALAGHVQALSAAHGEAQATVAALRASTSWRITAPLRALRHALPR